MSQQALSKFRDLVRASREIQEQIRSAAANGSLDLVALGNIHGCEFTADEVQAFLRQEAELSDFELDMVVGGWGRSSYAWEDVG